MDNAGNLVFKQSLGEQLLWLNLNYAKMLIQERESLEQKNLRWVPSEKKYTFMFDLNEADNYEFIESPYLGKDKTCILKGSDTPINIIKAQTILNNVRVKEEYTIDNTGLIITILSNYISNTVSLCYKLKKAKRRISVEEILLREYKRTNKQAEYIELKKRLVDELFGNGWEKLGGLILKEDNEYITDAIEFDKTNTAFNLELSHLVYSIEDPRMKDRKLK
jgi:hypothetical protein